LIAVELAASLTDEHKTLVLRYLGAAERFSLAEWVTLLEAFTMLSDSTVQLQGTTLTLQAFYDRFINSFHETAKVVNSLQVSPAGMTRCRPSAPSFPSR
jgi:hypothetical protein